MEVMIAMGIFFIAVFAILELVTTNLRNARLLQETHVDASWAMADIYQSPTLEEGETNGDFGKNFPGYTWRGEIEAASSNGLFRIRIFVTKPDHTTEENLDTMMWKPNSKPVPK